MKVLHLDSLWMTLFDSLHYSLCLAGLDVAKLNFSVVVTGKRKTPYKILPVCLACPDVAVLCLCLGVCNRGTPIKYCQFERLPLL